jgi:hypothetical protein
VRHQPTCLGLIAPPRCLTKLRRGERETDRTRERGVHLDNQRGRGNKKGRKKERKEKKGKKKGKNRLSVIYKLY